MEQLDKWNKELSLLNTKSYKAMDKELFTFYKDALKELKNEIKQTIDNYDKLTFSKRLEVDNQIKIANKIDEILWEMNDKTNPAIHQYISGEANTGYYGVWYALEEAENLQLNFPLLNESYIERLVEKKIAGKSFSKRLYEKRDDLAEKVTTALLNGAVKGKGYAVVAKEIGELTEASYKQSLRIARTEGGRVQSAAKQKSYQEAVNKGVKMEKMWMATLDKKTRHSHQELDGQTVAVDKKFKFNGYTADAPRLFGRASLDINCRCTTIAVVNGLTPNLRKDNVTKKVVEYNKYSDWYVSKKVQNEIGKQKYTEYVGELSKKHSTKDFGKLLDKMSDREYEKLGVLDISDNEIEWIPKRKRG
ncbi:phage minor head protein [Carnobacterium jeotgali]|uniref:phage head morphogenesis protein n=1 Tax=Carnobacterium jeotgali TaxID=545534 RepID=UPI00068E60DA|nr:phage minor head protein [Carnobacterium jeotgali]